MKRNLSWGEKYLLYPLFILIGLFLIVLSINRFTTHPSNNRDWSTDQAVLPYAVIHDNIVGLHNIRNFSYTSSTTFTPNYYDKIYDLNKLTKVWYVVEPFSGFPGAAHTFLSFQFSGDQGATSTYVAISVEIRKEKGESFSAIKGLFNQYELMYVAADERDVIKLRSNYRKDQVYVYPVKATQEKARELFVAMLTRMNTLKDHPEFYNSITNNCTTNIADQVDAITPNRVPLMSWRILLPSYSDKLAYDLGLIDTTLPFEQARERYLINDKAEKYADDPDFSDKIRGTN